MSIIIFLVRVWSFFKRIFTAPNRSHVSLEGVMVTVQQIEELTRRIREGLDPERIVLFGSYARGDASEHSDVDLLVVAETSLPPHERFGTVRRLLADYAASFDIIVKTPEEYARWRSVVNHIVYFADKHGKVLYERGNAGSRPPLAGESGE